jgi:hypothetical protein
MLLVLMELGVVYCLNVHQDRMQKINLTNIRFEELSKAIENKDERKILVSVYLLAGLKDEDTNLKVKLKINQLISENYSKDLKDKLISIVSKF